MDPFTPLHLPTTVTDLMSRTITRLRRLPIQPDPIVPPHLLRPYGILTSAVRADGQILEATLFEALKTAPHLTVFRTPAIFIPPMVDHLVSGGASSDALRFSDLHYEHDEGRRIAPDLLVIDARRNAADFLEIKRGLAKTDAGKTRQTTRDLRCLRLVAKSYVRSKLNIEISEVTAGVCAIHGATTVPAEHRVDLDALEARYQTEIRRAIEATHQEFSRQLEELLLEQSLKDKASVFFDRTDTTAAPF
ncbi:hypothetical protein [Nitrospirillum bahiense]|uniref:Uncharacterized protein n=1 Tax=Nitrospirillum amazonense TaxID=28077 RepID=A0A560FVT6_9PROT|nr:hypothetical protein [Nitrospirillum amazonense]TWB25724.1 hypothetical protein FBZ88_109121 [Nitrospirillum amazonense]